MKEHPIIFSGPMILRLLADRKSQTRRLAKHWRKVKRGDLLWVRECFVAESEDTINYRADGWDYCDPIRWKPSIHMPRWASRITLEATEDARSERLRDISKEDAIAEGIRVFPLQSADDPSAWWQSAPEVHQDRTPRGSFFQLWDSLHTKHPFRSEDNPAVVVLSFKRAR